ncbi:MAG: N-acetylmuramoyl-L-alanine amidase [Burkholderiales bacterium]|nr:N-acetylmuramoyl-L-alanine amidase [Burkholderiales bacterium]
MKRSILITALLLAACSGTRIAVDVGHSKLHPGATSSRGVSEFEFNSTLARVVAQELRREGATPILIGIDGKMDDLHARTPHAKGAKFYLSIHHDSSKDEYFSTWEWHGKKENYADQFSGFSLFVSRKNPYPEKSLECASAIGARLMKAGFAPSTYHADKVLGEGREWADEKHGVYWFDNLVVLKTATQPAALLEAGVIVNRKEEKMLSTDETRRKIASAVRAGLFDCKILP